MPAKKPRPPANRHFRKLGEELLAFVHELAGDKLTRLKLGLPREADGDGAERDERRRLTARFRRAVLEAAAHGAEVSLRWHSLGVWTEIGKARIGCLARAVEVERRDRARYAEEPGQDD